jgi:divinyl protochlorophyllide a 8-vinyl-reductase
MPRVAKQGSRAIGPNAVIQLARAVRSQCGADSVQRLFQTAGLLHYLAREPEHMVPEDDVVRLYAALSSHCAPADAERLSAQAGFLTGQYLLAHRIPRRVQSVLKLLPARLAAWILLRAIARHAWTFAGSGRFSVTSHRPLVVEIAGGPLSAGLATSRPLCSFYAATFEALFRALIDQRTQCATALSVEYGGRALFTLVYGAATAPARRRYDGTDRQSGAKLIGPGLARSTDV